MWRLRNIETPTSGGRVVFTTEEVALLIGLAAQAEPDRFPHPNPKALIWKCRDVLDNNRSVTFRGL